MSGNSVPVSVTTKNENPKTDTKTNSSTQNPTTTPKSKKQTSRFLLFAIISTFTILCIGTLLALLSTLKPDKEDITPTAVPTIVATEEIKPTPAPVSRDLFLVANCTLFKSTDEGEFEVIKTESEDLCSRNGFIAYQNSMIVSNTDPEVADEFKIPLLNIKTGDIYDALIIEGETYFDETTGSVFYAYRGDGIYKSSLTSSGSKIFDLDLGEGGGRGIASSDDFGLRMNQNNTRLVYQDTAAYIFESEDSADETLYHGAIVISPTGSTLLEIPGASQSIWKDDDTLLTIVTTSNEGNRVLRRYVFDGPRYEYTDLAVLSSNFGVVYNMDVLGDKVLMSVVADGRNFSTYIADISGDAAALRDLGINTLDNYFVDTDTIIGYVSMPCSGDFMDTGIEQEAPCPIDAPFDVYKKSVSRYSIPTGESEIIVEMEQPTLLY